MDNPGLIIGFPEKMRMKQLKSLLTVALFSQEDTFKVMLDIFKWHFMRKIE